MATGITRFIDSVPEYEIRDGVVHVMVGGEELCCSSLRTFRMATARAGKCLAEHDARNAEVVPIKRRRGHAATS